MSGLFYNARNLVVDNGFVRNPNRYYLEEFYKKLPYVNGIKNSTITERGTVNTNTTSEEVLASVTIPANSIVIGDVIHIVGMGQVISAVSTDTSTIRIRLGATSALVATTIATSAALDVTTGDDIYIDMYITIRTIGSSGTMIGHGQIRSDADGSTLLNIILASTAINTTVKNYIGFTNQWSVANTDNQIAADTFIVDITHLNNYQENKDFEILGTNAASAKVTFSSTRAGINMETSGTTGDKVIILPHLDTDQTAWTGIKWGTENQVEWECAILIPNITDICVWAGLKLTNVPTISADNGQAYFLFDTATASGGVPSKTTLHFIYNVGSIIYTTDLEITLEADIIYRLRISIDNYRKISIFVNEVQYGLTSTSGIASTSATESNETLKSEQLADDIDLIPYVGVQQIGSNAKDLVLCYQKISRILFE